MTSAWTKVQLAEVITERKEVPSADDLAAGKVRIVAKVGFNDGRIQFRADGQTKTGMILIRPGDLILSGINAAKGAIAVYGEDNTEPVAATIHYGAYIPNKTRVDASYLWWLLRSRAFRDLLLQYVPGGIKTELKPKRLLPIPIPLPPLSEQRRIVARIEELASKIEEAMGLREQAVEEAETLFRCIKSNCMTDALSAYGGEPLGNLVSMASGEGLTSSEMDDSFQFPVYGGGGITGRYSRYLFEESMIAIGRVGARCGCVYITEPRSWITDNALYLSRISDRLDKQYLVNALTNLDLRQQANQAAQPVVSQKKIKPIEIPVPPLSGQRRIVAYLDNLQANADSLERLQTETAAELDAILPSILDKAFKGEF